MSIDKISCELGELKLGCCGVLLQLATAVVDRCCRGNIVQRGSGEGSNISSHILDIGCRSRFLAKPRYLGHLAY